MKNSEIRKELFSAFQQWVVKNELAVKVSEKGKVQYTPELVRQFLNK
jgi:hypothetical protein